MRVRANYVRLSASDLSNHLACHHLTSLNLSVVLGKTAKPKWQSPDLWVLRKLGEEHEKRYQAYLRSSGLEIVDVRDIEDEDRALAETCAAMQKGVAVIAQATLANGRWFGRADILRRVERESRLGNWSYEVYDCKLARETKAATILQLSLYSELLAEFQGVLPEWMYVVPARQDFQAERHRLLDFAAYYRYIKARLEASICEEQAAIPTYPEPNPYCEVCHWWPECDTRWRKDDHLSLVAGISGLQRKQLLMWEVGTVGKLAELPLPLNKRPEHGSPAGYVAVREQARLQVVGRTQGRPVHELLGIADDRGLARLPDPSPADVFFDLEGDRFVGPFGQEYLFGCVMEDQSGTPKYECRWAFGAEGEKKAFEWFVDSVMARWAQYPVMHVYHFASYEPAALKRMMGNYATREDEIDRMLRAGLLVDLHTVLKQAIRASVEEYSLKALEVFHGFRRSVPLDAARLALRQVQHDLELGRQIDLDDTVRNAVEGYNADDCFSTRSLRDWLERERTVLEGSGHKIARPPVSTGAAPEGVGERQERVTALVTSLSTGIPPDAQQRTEEHSGVWLLANLLDWHRRENKAEWWEFYRLRDLLEEDLLYERSALAGMKFVNRVGLIGKLPVDRYSFEKQETAIRRGDIVCMKGDKIGEVLDINLAQRRVDIKKTKKTSEVHPSSVFADSRGPSFEVLAESLFRLGIWVKDNGLDVPGSYRAVRDLILRRPPRLTGGARLTLPEESIVDAAKRIVGLLDNSVLAIQGPPGAGKTYTGARMICELVRQGKKVGIAAVSHKVIRNLLDEVLVAAQKGGPGNIACIEKVSEIPEGDPPDGLTLTSNNADVLAAIQDGSAHVAAGTSWLWAREEFFDAVDVLFMDEAGQMSLANVVAIAQAAKSLVLLGDPQQLDQPLKGSHPEGAEVSALEHVLAGAKTIHHERGLFLEKTWRLHPKICTFTSEVFYEGRLQSREGLDQQRIDGHYWLGNAGSWFIPVHHAGNQTSSPEEVERIAGIVDSLLKPGVLWTDEKGEAQQLQLDDILIVAPYNAQVSDLSARLPSARVGTVDKFQGQEAPVVIYSLTTSSPEDAPRGMEFLYSLNRLNVATSRARAIVIIVGSLRLLQPECRSPRQMQLANALCRYIEMASILDAAVMAQK